MSILMFDKDGVSQVKQQLLSPQSELYTILNDINNNLDIIRANWKGQRSNVTLEKVDIVKQKNDFILKKLEENIISLGGVIKTYDKSENAGVVSSSTSFNGPIGSVFNSSKMLSVNIGGQNFFAVNTRIDPLKYGIHVDKYNLDQGGANGNKCLMIAQFYAKDMMEGKMSSFEEYKRLQGGPATKINNSIKSENIEEIKVALYSMLKNGYPAVVKVSQSKGGRHYVTAIGFKSSVTSPSQLTEDNILVLDNATGKISTLADSGYGNRKFYKQSNKYEVIGPNQKFIGATTGNVYNA